MAWNEPGGGKPRDPWRDSGDSPGWDALLKRLRRLLDRLSGGSGGGGVGIAVIGILIAWCVFDSVVRINASEAGIVLRFGGQNRLMTPGINFKFPRPIEAVVRVDVGQVRPASDQVRMLTRDENIVVVDFNVQYQVRDPELFAFGVRDPDATLGQAAESAVRAVIGGSDMDTILSGQRTELMARAKQILQGTLDQYDTGLVLTELNFQNVRPPQEVKDAFDDASRALQDKQRLEEEARAYASRVVPEARGDAAMMRAEAEGYKSERIARAQGDVARFSLVEAEYRAAPEVTRKRLYLETVEQVLGSSAKLVDLGQGRNILSLPLPQAGSPALPPAVAAEAVAPPPAVEARARGTR